MLMVASIRGHRQTAGNRPRIFVGIATAFQLRFLCMMWT